MKRSDHFKTGRDAEKRANKDLGLSDTRASGSMVWDKGDGKSEGVLAEHKSTQKWSVSVKYEWLNKIAHEAMNATRIPLLVVSFVTGDGRPRKNGRWVMIREEDYKQLGIDQLLERRD